MFAEAVAQTAVAAGRDDTLPMLTGIRVEIADDTLDPGGDRPVPAGGPRAAVAAGHAGPGHRRAGARAHPGRCRQDPRRCHEVTVALGEGLLGLQAGGRRTTVRLLDVEFVKYRSLLPDRRTPPPWTSPWPTLGESIKRVALVTDRGHHLRMQVGDGSLTLTAGGDDEGRAEEELQVDATAPNCSSRSTRLPAGRPRRALHSPTVRLAFTTPSRPALLLPVGADARPRTRRAATPDGRGGRDGVEPPYRYLVMPARLPG